MVTNRKDSEPVELRHPPAKTPEGREIQLTSLAFDLAQARLENGTATGQEVIYFLKMGAEDTKLQREKLRHENVLTEARAAQLGKSDDLVELWKEGIAAFKGYSLGAQPEEEILEEYDG